MHPLAAQLLQSPILAALPIIMRAELMITSPARVPARTISFYDYDDFEQAAGSFGTPIISPPPYPWYHNVEGTDRAWGHVGHGAFFALSGYVLQL